MVTPNDGRRKWHWVQRRCTKGQTKTPPASALRVALFAGEPAELGGRVDAELFHQLRAVRLDRAQADAKVVGDLLVEPARDDAIEDFAFTRREHRQALARSLRL